MTGTKERSFLFGTDAAACAEPGKRFGFICGISAFCSCRQPGCAFCRCFSGSEREDVFCLSIIFGIH